MNVPPVLTLISTLAIGLLLLTASACDDAVDGDCFDGIENGAETGIDCGGSGGICAACAPGPTCTDNKMNGTETGVDCGGSCLDCGCGGCGGEYIGPMNRILHV